MGKTSIVNRLVNDRFERDEKKTEGIQITEWKLRSRYADSGFREHKGLRPEKREDTGARYKTTAQ